MGARSYHLRFDVAGALRQTDAHIEGAFENPDGSPVRAWEVRSRLKSLLEKGVKYLPAGHCDNWDEAEQRCGGHAAERVV